MSDKTRRAFLQDLAVAAGAVVLMPVVTSCKSDAPPTDTPKATEKPVGDAKKIGDSAKKPPADAKKPAADAKAPTAAEIPKKAPEGWDPIAYNRTRGNAGAIPESYRGDINGADGVKKHLGKHLPYVPKVDAAMVPAGFIAIMWGDPGKGYVRHPNAPKGPGNNNEGHWYNWIKVRKAVDGDAEELQSTYVDWPGDDPRKGGYAVFGGGDITADGGKNTIYLAALPKDVKKGDAIRIWAHCLTHGEYVDFLSVA